MSNLCEFLKLLAAISTVYTSSLAVTFDVATGNPPLSDCDDRLICRIGDTVVQVALVYGHNYFWLGVGDLDVGGFWPGLSDSGSIVQVDNLSKIADALDELGKPAGRDLTCL